MTAPSPLPSSGRGLFAQHLAQRLAGLEEDLAATSFDGLVLASGRPYVYFRDDQPAPFRADPHFLHFCPRESPGDLLVLAPGRRPVAVLHQPEDFWYETSPLGDPFWASGFEIVEAGDSGAAGAEARRRLPDGRIAFVGENAGGMESLGIAANPKPLLSRMDWRRATKSPYEIACIAEANRIGAAGHRAAEAAFRSGESEAGIHHAFVGATGGIESDLPYPTIVGLNEKGAVLHYDGKRADVTDGRCLLIDAGARVLGYASDITRTHAGVGASGAFLALLSGMERVQQALAADAIAGASWFDVHQRAHLGIARLLRDEGIVRIPAEDAVETGLSTAFFPHGLGHHLGIQVHDVGGRQRNPEGRETPPPEGHPSLRNTRPLTPGQVLTVEPGLYFIPMLLRRFREGPEAARRAVDWDRVDALLPYGGVRIEDNVVVTDGAPRNLTREHLPDPPTVSG